MGQLQIKDSVVLLDDEDADRLDGWIWHLHKTSHSTYARGYPRGNRSGGLSYMHRVITGACNGDDVDHINGNGLDNRRSNLRICTRTQNSANRKIVQSKTSSFKGVHFDSYSKRWRSEITANNKRYRLGRFDTEEKAVAAYMQKAKELFGEFAHMAVNQPVRNEPNP